jgi:hypothetical protein
MSTLVVTLGTGSTAGMFALVDKAEGALPLWLWIAGVVLFGVSGWCSFRVMELDKDLVMTVSKKFGAIDDDVRAAASTRSAELETQIGTWTFWMKVLFFGAAIASMSFAIVSRKEEKVVMTDKVIPQDVIFQGASLQGIDHRNLKGLSEMVEATTPIPSEHAPVEPAAPPAESTNQSGAPAPSE